MESKPIAIIAGVGPGIGASVARHFATAYTVILMARSSHHYASLAEEINKSGGEALGISTDLSDIVSISKAFNQIEQKYQGAACAVAVFNAAGGFIRKPLLELTDEEFSSGFMVNVRGAFMFSQRVLPLLVRHTKGAKAKHPPTLIFTGATASVKANPLMATFASSKFALRALSMSIAKEFGPDGVHVAHAVIDGVVDIPEAKDFRTGMPADAKVSCDDIAQSYWNLHTQSRRCFTYEIDIRPMLEKW